MSTQHLLVPGQPVGLYIVETYLTTGSFGDLYLAKHGTTQERVALKIIQIPSGVRVGRDLFALGERLLALSHPCLVQVREMHLDETPPYHVMAYAEGGSLSQRLDGASRSPMGAAASLPILARVGAALTYLHEQNIVHRGVQPASILFDEQGQALLSGLDLAQPTDQVPSPQVITALYHAPEEERGVASPRSDQFALGCLAYHLLTGSRPSREMRRDLAQRVEEQIIPSHIGRAVLRALAEVSTLRLESVADFVAALGADRP